MQGKKRTVSTSVSNVDANLIFKGLLKLPGSIDRGNSMEAMKEKGGLTKRNKAGIKVLHPSRNQAGRKGAARLGSRIKEQSAVTNPVKL